MFSSNRPLRCLSLARPFSLCVPRPRHTAHFHFLQNAPVWQAHTDISTPMFPNKMAIDKIHFQPQIWLLQGCTVSKCSVTRWHSEELLLMRNTLLLLFPWKINARCLGKSAVSTHSGGKVQGQEMGREIRGDGISVILINHRSGLQQVQ